MAQNLHQSATVAFVGNNTILRIKGGVVDGLGSRGGPFTRFIVHVRRPGVIVLQNKQEPQHYLAIKENTLCTGEGGPFCEFAIRTSDFKPSMISLESCSYPGQHVGIHDNGSVKPPATCGRGPFASFTVELVEAANGSHYLQQGNTVGFICNSTGNPMRIKGGVVDGLGGRGGPYTRFIVHVRRPGVIALQNKQEPQHYLAIKGNTLCTGQGGPYCEFGVRNSDINPSMISLESCSFPGQHVGIQDNGSVKPPATCARGPHASYTVELVESPNGSHYLHHANTVSFICNSTGNPLRIKGGVVDGQGGIGGPYTRFIVHVRGPGVIALQNKQEPQHYLAIKEGTLCTGQGGPYCEFGVRSSDFNQSMISLESCSFPGQHVGIQNNGSVKPPATCARGPHASFTVQPV